MNIDAALAWIGGGWKTDKNAHNEGGRLGIDVDGYYGFQCVDFSEGYSIFIGAPFNAGVTRNAITLWQLNQPGWTQVQSPTPGDVFVKDYVGPDGIDYGHTGVVQSVQSNGITSIDQNWFNSSLTVGSPPAPVFHPTGTLKGFLRCASIGVAMPSKAEVLSAFRQYKLPDPTADQQTYYAARPWSVLIEDLFNWVSGNETLNAASVNDGFQLAFSRDATPQEVDYWTKRNPDVFLKALLGSKPSGLTKDQVEAYIAKNLS